MKKNNNQQARPTYTEDQKIGAVAILLGNSKGDGGMSGHAVALAREYLQSNVSTDTFHRWIALYRDRVADAVVLPDHNEHTIQVIHSAQGNAIEVMENIRDQLLAMVAKEIKQHPNEVKKQGLQRLVTSAAILQDKIKDAVAMSAAMQAAIRPLAMICNERGLDVYTLIADLTTTVQAMSQDEIDAYKNKGSLAARN